ncbi:MAG: ABC transporter permease [Alicyclobacillaceae bacterium]|nr:ABC transporter permease [Alicyclobacillaceae bacterium]
MWRNPLLRKEFRQRMRTARAPVVISGYLVSMSALTFALLYESVQGQTLLLLPARSEQIFVALSWLQMTVAAFLTPAFAAGSVSGERERRTLPVLLTTPLSPFSILAGKILSSSALLALLLMVTLPLYSLVFLFGGAVPQEVVSVFAFQLFTIVLIAALSVFWSTVVLRSGWSTVLAYATVAWMVVGTGVLGYGLSLLAERNPIDAFAVRWANELLNLNPLWVEASLEGAVQASPYAWVVFVAVYGVVAVALAIPAIWRLRPQAMSVFHRSPRTKSGGTSLL